MKSPPRSTILRRDAASAGRILAIDYGRRRIGLALSDELRLTAQPLATIVRTNRRNDLRRLREIVRKNGIRAIVVGHPVRLDGSAGQMAEEAERFATRLRQELGLPVELMDERLSSWEAAQVIAKPPSSKKKSALDHIAAAVILRDYLEHLRTSA